MRENVLATRTFRSLHNWPSACWSAVITNQALGLVRMAMEDMLVRKTLRFAPRLWNSCSIGDPNDKVRLGRGDLSYGAMSARVIARKPLGMEENLRCCQRLRATPEAPGCIPRHVGWKNLPHLSCITPTTTDSSWQSCVQLVAKESMSHLVTRQWCQNCCTTPEATGKLERIPVFYGGKS